MGAIMNTTYAKVWENVDQEWKSQRTYYQAQFFCPRRVFPAPLRWVYFLAKYVYRSRTRTETGKEDIARRKTEYIYLLRKLVDMAVRSQRGDAEKERKERLRLEDKIEEDQSEQIRLREDVERLQTMLNSAQQLINNMQSQKRDDGDNA